MLTRVLALLALALLPLGAAAQVEPCEGHKAIDLADGSRVCLRNYPLMQTAPLGQDRTLEQMLPSTRNYALAAPMGPQCPAFVTMAITRTLWSATTADMVEMIGKAKASCEAAVAQRGLQGCECQIVVNQGLSPLSRGQWDDVFTARAAAPAMPAAAPSNVPAVAAAPRDDVVERLQERLAAMEAERARASAPVAAAGVPKLSARALVIGNSKYTSFAPLANPLRDARAIATKLRGFGIEVDLVLDAQRDDLIHALNEHTRKASGRDVSILYYAGHGVQVEGTNYIIPVNMRADGITAGYVKLAGISLAAAMDYLPAKTRIVFLDACRDNPATRSLLGTRGGTAGLAPMNVASGTLLSYATRDGATADDGAGLNSPYTTALLKHLDQPQDISLVLRQVRQTVLQLTGGRQEPWEYGSLVGEQIVLPLMAR